MDLNDIEKELDGIQSRSRKPVSGPDYSVKHSGLKVLASRLIAILFFLAIVLFGIYTLLNADTARIDLKVAAIVAVVYIALGAFVALKLWNINITGWVALFFIALACIGLPVLSAINHGVMVGTIPIIAASILALAVLYWIRDLYRIKKFGDIFRMP
jgi:lysylphosphatidylglycerol synthetase-like protein (DUF2156 family)